MISRISGSTDNSFAIVGGRKIGKSSLLHKIKENPAPGVTYIYMDLEYEFSNVKSYRTFIKSLQAELERRFQKKIDFSKFPFGVDLSRIRPAIQELSQNGEKIVFIFDEMDGLIKFDQKHNFKLMRIFRTMSQKDYCQFIFAGFKELYHHTRDIENPFYNFFEEIILEPLEREAAMDLITSPMESIGVHYHNREDRELILGYTACHPNLLQFFCKSLVEEIEKHKSVEKRRTIFTGDIEELYDTKYEEYIMDQVYMFSSLCSIKQLILVLLVEEHQDGKIFSESEINEKLIENGISIPGDHLHRHLKNLVMRFILLDKGKDNYCFALPVFPEILRKRIDEYLKNKIILESKTDASKSL
jgi:hypothetical protein